MGVLKRNRREGGIEGRIQHAIDHLVPLLRIEACQIQLVSFEPANGIALLRIEGGCSHCDMSAVTLLQGIEAHLRRSVPEIREVRALDPGCETDA
jgi:Fe-S cluster biogenesis protein NfuA